MSAPIKTRTFQQEYITEIGLGCWQLGADWGHLEDEAAVEILNTAYQNGIRFFDTAAGYGGGRSERILGTFRQSLPEKDLFIATKIGRKEPTEAHLRRGVAASSERLQMEALDLIQLHCWTPEHLHQPVVWDTLRALKSEGKIRHFGASVESVEEARYCMQQDGLASLQIIFNIFRQHPRDEFFEEASSKGIALIVRLPLASGLLTGKFSASTTFGEDDHRHYNRDGAAFHVGETFCGIPFHKGLDLVETLQTILPNDPPLATQAIRWILDHPAVTTVIPGASSPQQVVQNVYPSSLSPLPAGKHEELAAFYRDQVLSHVRGQY